MPMKIWKPLHPRIEIDVIEVQDEEESAASEETVSKYVKGEEE